MTMKLIGIAVLLAVGFMMFRPRRSRGGYDYHESDPESSTRDGNSATTHTKRGGGCCG